MLKIHKTYKDEDNFEVITKEQAVTDLEGAGYFLQGTVEKVLKENIELTLQSNYATFDFC